MIPTVTTVVPVESWICRYVKDSLTLRDIGKLYVQGVLLPQFVGTASQIADRIDEGSTAVRLMDTSCPHLRPGTFVDFVAYVVSELQRRGLFRTDYTRSTLRDHLGLAYVDAEAAPPVRA